MTEEEQNELLVQAKRNYPIGTTYSCLKDGCTGKSVSEPIIYADPEGFSIHAFFKNDSHHQYIWLKGKWATIAGQVPGSVTNQYQIY